MLRRAWPFAFALAGVAVALLAPASVFSYFRSHVVGLRGPDAAELVVAPVHRAYAVAGSVLAAAVLAALARRPQVSVAPPARAPFVVAAVALLVLVFFNLRYAGVQLGLFGLFIRDLYLAYWPSVVVFTGAAWIALGTAPWRALDAPGALSALALGAAYGAFSSLWHCCPPAWESDVAWPLSLSGVVVWAVAFAAFVAATAARAASPRGELAGALLFAFGYPWHTPLWFVQGLLGGAFSVWLARRSGSSAAPGVFLATSYVVHTTLPYAFA